MSRCFVRVLVGIVVTQIAKGKTQPVVSNAPSAALLADNLFLSLVQTASRQLDLQAFEPRMRNRWVEALDAVCKFSVLTPELRLNQVTGKSFDVVATALTLSAWSSVLASAYRPAKLAAAAKQSGATAAAAKLAVAATGAASKPTTAAAKNPTAAASASAATKPTTTAPPAAKPAAAFAAAGSQSAAPVASISKPVAAIAAAAHPIAASTSTAAKLTTTALSTVKPAPASAAAGSQSTGIPKPVFATAAATHPVAALASTAAKPTTVASKSTPQLAATVDTWLCQQCTFMNSVDSRYCQMCEAAVPALSPWTCPMCTFADNSAAHCSVCGVGQRPSK